MFVLRKSKNFTSNFLIHISQIIPINHYKGVYDAPVARRAKPMSCFIISC